MEKNIGFIGSGNMSQAIQGGIIQAGVIPHTQVYVSDIITENLDKVKAQFQVNVMNDNKSVAQKADVLFIAVKPHIYPLVIEEIKNDLKEDCVVISIAAGLSLQYLESLFNDQTKIVRTMPNTPALVGKGMSALCPNEFVDEQDLDLVKMIFKSFGEAEVIEESLFDAVTAVSGSAPAYVFMMIEAMGDAAVLAGMPRAQAYKFAAQTLLGSAQMVLETQSHPGVLKDNVCSPKGTTIEAVAMLEKEGFRHALISAMDACVKKSEKMTK